MPADGLIDACIKPAVATTGVFRIWLIISRSMLSWIELFAAGIVCGFLNAAASSGAAITLPILLALGLPPSVANGTNRLPVIVGMFTAFVNFQRAKAIPWRFTLQLLPVFLAFALAGASFASVLPMEQVRRLVHVAIILALLLLLLKPSRWLAADAGDLPARATLKLKILMAVVGAWAGLIVLDSGTYLLIALVLVGGLSLRQANAIKVVLIGSATLMSVAVFLLQGEVNWFYGVPLMIGSAFGGSLGARLALGPAARQWIYRLLLGALSIEAAMSLWASTHPAMQRLMM